MPAHARAAAAASWEPERWVRDRLDVVRRDADAVAAAVTLTGAAPCIGAATGPGRNLLALVALLVARFGDPTDDGVLPAATALALVERGCRYHDDVRERAGADTVRHHNDAVIMVGDLLLVRALEIAARLGAGAVRTLARAVGGSQEVALELCHDEPALSDGGRRELIGRRTVALLVGAVELGSAQAHVNTTVVVLLREFAHHLGRVAALPRELPGADAGSAGRAARDGHLAAASGVLARLPVGAPTEQLAGLVGCASMWAPSW